MWLGDIARKLIETGERAKQVKELTSDELLDLQWQELADYDPHSLRYVLDENCLIVSPTLATVFDIEKAIIIQQIHYFVCINRQRKESSRFKMEGKYWMSCTPAKWQKMLPFISPSSLKRKLQELVTARVVVRKQSHADHDYITYYRLDYKTLERLINDFVPDEQSFKLHSLKHILRSVRFNKKTGVIERGD